MKRANTKRSLDFWNVFCNNLLNKGYIVNSVVNTMFHGNSLLTILVTLCRTNSFFKYTTIVQESLKYCSKRTEMLKIMKIQVAKILCTQIITSHKFLLSMRLNWTPQFDIFSLSRKPLTGILVWGSTFHVTIGSGILTYLVNPL